MKALPPQPQGANGTTPATDQAGVLLLSVPDALGGVSGTPLIDGTPASAPTSLDPEKHPDNDEGDLEDCKLPDEWCPPTEFQCYPLFDKEARFWHSAHVRERRAVFNALKSMGKHRQLHRYVNCGSMTRIMMKHGIGDEFQFRVASCKCHHRWCPHCSKGRSTIYAANVRSFVKDRNATLRLVTLTMRHTDTPLKDQIDRINRSFLALRKRTWWKGHVDGGVSFIEIKVGNDNRYHVHCHMIIEGAYLPHNELSHEWHAVTGDSPVVDVRMIGDVEKVAGYVAKYGSKPIDRAIVFQPKRLIECIQALQGRRLATCFGSWKALKLNDTPDDDDPKAWQDLGTPSDFIKSEWFEQMQKSAPLLAERILAIWKQPNEPNESS